MGKVFRAIQETQYKRIVALASAALVFAIYAVWQLSGDIFKSGKFSGFKHASGDIYLLSCVILMALTVVVILIRSHQDRNQVRHLESHDVLTNLPNLSQLQLVLAKNHENQQAGGVLFQLDVARLKSVNHTAGLEAGDQIVTALAKRFALLFEKPNFVARTGGGTFAIFVPGFASVAGAKLLARKIAEASKLPIAVDNRTLFIDIKIGACLYDGQTVCDDAMLEKAEVALTEAKVNEARELVIYDQEIANNLQAKSTLETELREVLEKEEIEPYFQPLFEEDGKRLVGFEALARWNHSNRGFISPSDFVPIAENLGLIEQLGRVILLKACMQVKPLGDLKVSVNISPRHLLQPGFVTEIKTILTASGLAPHRLELEITETVLVEDAQKANEIISKIRDFGIAVALDDFGTGYSALSCLDKYKVDRIKVDATFVSNLETSTSSRSMIEAIVKLARERKFAITIEGVETKAQLDYLKQLGSLCYQGFYFSKPLSLVELQNSKILEQYNVERFEAATQQEDCAQSADAPCPQSRLAN